MHAYACASMWRAGCMCSVGTAGVRVARFRDGGHVELTWRRVDLRPARTRHGDWTGRRRNGVWPGRGVVQPTYESQGTAFGAQARRRETPRRTKGDASECACDRRGLARLRCWYRDSVTCTCVQMRKAYTHPRNYSTVQHGTCT